MGDLQAEQVLYVKYVHRAGTVGRNLCRGNLQVQFRKRRCHVVKKTRSVAAVDLDHGLGIGRLVVHDNPRLVAKDTGARRQGRLQAQLATEATALGDDFFQGIAETAQRRRFGDGLAVEILDPETVERHAVGQGKNFRVHDVDPGQRHPARDTRKQPRIVHDINRDLGDGAENIDMQINVQRFLGLVGGADNFGVAHMGVRIEGQPVGAVGAAQVIIEDFRAPALEPCHQRILGRGHPLRPRPAGVLARHHRFGGVIQLTQKRRLPAVPDRGTDGAYIGHRQAQKQAQPFRGLHHGDEIGHGLRIVYVATKRGVGHHQVMTHQPGGGFGFFRVETESRPQALGDLGAQHGMIPAPTLGDVMQQDGDVERAARRNFMDDFTGYGHDIGHLALLDTMQDAEREDGVLVHRVDVIHVVLHLRDDAPEVGNETPEDAGFIHAAQHHLGVARVRQQIQKQPVRFLVATQLFGNQRQGPGNQAQCRGMNIHVLAMGNMKQPDERNRVLYEGIVAGDAHASAFDDETLDLAPGVAEE